MGATIFTCPGGSLVLPDRALVLVSREDGGQLNVTPPRAVWDRTELTPAELFAWSALIAAAARAMLETLPQLAGGCINYWDAGNWALNDKMEPAGPKHAREHRHAQMHLLGRSPRAASPSWRWGEAPRFPPFAERHAWAAGHEPLTDEECHVIVARTGELLRSVYA